MSVAKIVTPELYDVDGYPVDGGLMDLRLGAIDPGVRCRTCGGHLKEDVAVLQLHGAVARAAVAALGAGGGAGRHARRPQGALPQGGARHRRSMQTLLRARRCQRAAAQRR